ncbi:unnamed protein product [Meganyctiphanes norvegica]|uniref:Uncharacterized protein n=1 Tax=Meganyctiphanes norvegica TaxID=48144 RepID=A0AAV2PZZ5_MEGNR
MKFLIMCGLVAYCLLPCTALLNENFGLAEQGKNQAKLFGGYTTRTRLSTTTTTTFFTCALTLGTAACRRKKRSIPDLHDDGEIEELNSSLNMIEHNIEKRSADGEKGKLFVALTTFTTITTTLFINNPATTVSISFSCAPSGVAQPAFCG